jgi:hypothetical protein
MTALVIASRSEAIGYSGSLLSQTLNPVRKAGIPLDKAETVLNICDCTPEKSFRQVYGHWSFLKEDAE